MVKIVADTPDLENIIRLLTKTVTDNGGWLNDNLIIVARDRELSIQAKAIERGAPLIKITREMLIPMNKIELSIKNDAFHWHIPKPDMWDPVERAVTDITFEMFNLGNKAKFHKDNNFWLQMSNHIDTLDIMMAARTQGPKLKKMMAITRNKFVDTDINAYLCDDFIKSRVLGVKAPKTNITTHAIMTIIDFMNHHSNGAPFGTHDEGVSVACAQPLENSQECFAYYRPMDPFDTLTHYGFVDQSPNFVRSIPVTIQIPKLGRIAIKSRGDLLNQKKLAKQVQDLGFFMPVIEKTYDIVSASHIYIPGDSAPHALRRVLGVLIGRLARKNMSREDCMVILRDVERQIIEENKQFYENLLVHLDQKTEDLKTCSMLRNVKTMANLQLNNIKNYKCLDEYNATAARNALV